MRWAVEVVKSDPNRLEIIDPPFTLGVWLFGAAAAAFVLGAWLLPWFLGSLSNLAGAESAGASRVLALSSTFVRVALFGVALLFSADRVKREHAGQFPG